ncbi:MAG: site-specific integrase [Phycisphaerae bacterium]
MAKVKHSKSKSVPKYRRQKRRGRQDVAFCELSSQRVYLGLYGTSESRERYHRLVGEWETGGRQASAPASEITVADLAARFWEHAQAYYRRPDGTSTVEIRNCRLSLRPLVKLYGSIKVVDFGPKALKAVRQAMIDGGLCRRSVNQRIVRVRAVFKWGVAEELVPPDVLHGLQAVSGLKRGRTVARESEPVTPVPEGYVDAVRPYVSRQVESLIDLQLLTAARPGELVIMQAVDIDTSGRIWIYHVPTHKNTYRGQDRRIYIGPRGQEIIRPFMAARPVDAYVFSPAESVAERASKALTHRRPNQKLNPRLTDRIIGDCYTTGSYRRAIKQACRKAGIPSWTPHRLRHAAATRLRREFGLEGAQLLLGHAKADVTQLYAETNEARALEIAKKIG